MFTSSPGDVAPADLPTSYSHRRSTSRGGTGGGGSGHTANTTTAAKVRPLGGRGGTVAPVGVAAVVVVEASRAVVGEGGVHWGVAVGKRRLEGGLVAGVFHGVVERR